MLKAVQHLIALGCLIYRKLKKPVQKHLYGWLDLRVYLRRCTRSQWHISAILFLLLFLFLVFILFILLKLLLWEKVAARYALGFLDCLLKIWQSLSSILFSQLTMDYLFMERLCNLHLQSSSACEDSACEEWKLLVRSKSAVMKNHELQDKSRFSFSQSVQIAALQINLF